MPGKKNPPPSRRVGARQWTIAGAREQTPQTQQLRAGIGDDAAAAGVAAYQRRPRGCCIRPGDTDGEGLDMVRPLAGLTMGMALRVRVAAGWCSFSIACWLW